MGTTTLTAARQQLVTVLGNPYALNVACNRKDLVGKGVASAKNARSHEDLFNIMSNLISCKADVGKKMSSLQPTDMAVCISVLAMLILFWPTRVKTR